jgi:hypothetical protein
MDKLIDKIIDKYEEIIFLKFNGLDEAIIGAYCVDEDIRFIYSEKKCINILSKKMSQSDAHESFYVDIVDKYVGKNMPIICFDDFGDDEYK